MAEFPPTIALSSLDGLTGFRIDGAAAGDSSGYSVSSAGDVNGDGFDDIIVGADDADPNGNDFGSSYVVFGKAGGFATSLALSSLDGTSGFRLDGAAVFDNSGVSVSSAGDVNGDGFDDLIVGANRADPNGDDSGSSYVVFGKRDGFDPSLDLSSLDGTDGFRLDGVALRDYSGRFVSSAGDVNGDGFDDLFVGALGADPNGESSGSSYVVFGKAGGFGVSLALSRLNGTTGFRLDGAAAYDRSGVSVSSAGDVNGDGFDDLVVGAYRADPNGRTDAGSSYVVFGKAGDFAASLALGSLNGTTGFRLDGAAAVDYSGVSVSSAGDVNGDGFDDVIVGANRADPNGAYSGSSYVVFGKAGGFGVSLALSSLDGATGFRLDGAAAYDFSGNSVSSAGDVNGDGFDDLIVGNYAGYSNGSTSGSSYVVFGKAGGFDASLDLSSLDGTNGFRFDGAASNDYSGVSVSSAGDVNGDGFDDLVVGDSDANPGGRTEAGSSYVIFGRPPDTAVTRTGTDAANTISGGALNDRLIGLAGGDTLRGNAGSDALVGGSGADTLIGGLGADTAVYTGSSAGVTVDLSLGAAPQSGGEAAGDRLTGIENLQGSAFADSLTGDGNANLLLSYAGNDTIDGGGGADRIDGGTGADVMTGGLGDDRFFVDDSGDSVSDTSGNDTVFVTADWTLDAGQAIEFLRVNVGTGVAITGNALANTIYGGVGNDTVGGGAGQDQLFGGAGSDTFAFEAVTDSNAAARDTIRDFSQAQGDTIDLSEIQTNAADHHFFLASGSSFTKQAGELIVTQTNGVTQVQGDVDGNGKTDLLIVVGGNIALTANDFDLS